MLGQSWTVGSQRWQARVEIGKADAGLRNLVWLSRGRSKGDGGCIGSGLKWVCAG